MPSPPMSLSKMYRRPKPKKPSQEDALRLVYQQVEGCMGAVLALQDRIRTIRTELLGLLPPPEGDDIPF